MTTIEVPTIETSDLRARASFQAGAIAVQFAGSADSRAVTTIDRLLSKLHDEATRLHVREVIVDFRDFDFMNSSCFKAFVTWIGTVQERCFAIDLIQIDA
jgi:hypothetical protein